MARNTSSSSRSPRRSTRRSTSKPSVSVAMSKAKPGRRRLATKKPSTTRRLRRRVTTQLASLPRRTTTRRAPASRPILERAVRPVSAEPHRPPRVESPPRPVSVLAPVPGGFQPQSHLREETFTIPTAYGDHRIVLMVKDPWWLYAYWEIQPSHERQVRSQLAPEDMSGLSSVLRVYDVTGREFPTQAANARFDISLSGLATNWYIHVDAPDRSFVVELGLLTKHGRFLLLARSNRVTTPRYGPSDVVDEEWLTTDENYWKLFGVAAGIGMGSSPVGFKELLERKPFSAAMFSPGLFSPVKAKLPKGFWLWVDTELVIYGATDPKTQVTIQGQPVTLNPDGTFSTRMALPDGTQSIPVEATSSDQQDARTITTTVSRKTEGQTPQRRETRDKRPEKTRKTEFET